MKRNKHSKRKTKDKETRKTIVLLLLVCFALATGLLVAIFTFRQRHMPVAVHSASSSARKDQTPSPSPSVPASNTPAHDYAIPPVSNGMVPVISRIPTNEPVVFLTIDDGIYKGANESQLMKKYGISATLFLVHRFIQDDPSFFADLSKATGSPIEDHTYDHYLQTGLSYDQQRQDICSNADVFTSWFGRRPVLYRPPGGAYDEDSQRAAASCNMRALVLWDVTVNNGTLQYQSSGHLRPGDIVLMHFRSTFDEDLTAFVNAMKSAGLKTDLLENWLPQETVHT